ncbi:hypothetical protein ES288_A05G318200v1 [Gossypium darwinii]|uniref:Uncharacterized protein n=1 Tax=Gossypium darwinii TaxID=34276 RepID=A0A5D2GLX4_GOSDA|nr:hypothetical protein ES288_A05G318200v1 [Gossypium darwinii]
MCKLRVFLIIFVMEVIVDLRLMFGCNKEKIVRRVVLQRFKFVLSYYSVQWYCNMWFLSLHQNLIRCVRRT